MHVDCSFKLRILDGAKFMLSNAAKREEHSGSFDGPVIIELFAIIGILFDRG